MFGGTWIYMYMKKQWTIPLPIYLLLLQQIRQYHPWLVLNQRNISLQPYLQAIQFSLACSENDTRSEFCMDHNSADSRNSSMQRYHICISRNFCSTAADTSNGESAAGSNTKPKTSICAQSLECPEKKRRNSGDQQDTLLSEEDESVATNINGPAAELGEGLRLQGSSLNKKYEISLADEKYVCLCAV